MPRLSRGRDNQLSETEQLIEDVAQRLAGLTARKAELEGELRSLRGQLVTEKLAAAGVTIPPGGIQFYRLKEIGWGLNKRKVKEYLRLSNTPRVASGISIPAYLTLEVVTKSGQSQFRSTNLTLDTTTRLIKEQHLGQAQEG